MTKPTQLPVAKPRAKRRLDSNHVLNLIDEHGLDSCPFTLLVKVIRGDKLHSNVGDGKSRKVRPTMQQRIAAANYLIPYIAPKLSTQVVTMDTDEQDNGAMVITWAKQA